MAYIKQITVGGTAYDIKAAADASGNIIADTYVKKSGDTMTGNLHFSATATGSRIVFGNAPQSTGEQMYSFGYGGNDYAGLDKHNNLTLNTWYGLDITSQCAGTYQNMPTWSINARNGFTYQWGLAYLKRKTSIADNLPAGIVFNLTQTDNNITTGNSFIYCFDDHTDTTYGNNMVIQSSGNMIIGGGEAPTNYYNASLKETHTEHCYVVADANIYLKPGLNDVSNPNTANFVTVNPSFSSTGFAVRNIQYGTAAASGGSAGDVYIQYFN